MALPEDPFDQKLSLWEGRTVDIRDAAVWVTDTLRLSVSAAKSVFGPDGATSENVFFIYDRIESRAEDQERIRRHKGQCLRPETGRMQFGQNFTTG